MKSVAPVPVGSRYCCFAYAGEGPKSTAMHGSSPTTQASCPGSIRATGHSDFKTTQGYIDLAGETFRQEAELADERMFGAVDQKSGQK